MSVLLLLLLVALFGLGFLSPVWWLAAAALIFGLVHYSRSGSDGWSRGGDSEYRGYLEYRAYRDRQDRWDRRYRRQRQNHWDRRDREHRK
ncbi:hypothetical protein [Streptomyces sp. NPDC000229]|uniref:hypothetical protein n=1 Tax=Streptomyces sp. NPDC000229 TaxID=3154247 RepID=UPI0033250669